MLGEGNPQAGQGWPYKGTPEEMAAQQGRLKAAEAMYGKWSKEYRTEHMRLARLRIRRVRAERPPSKLRADREHRLRMIAERGKEKVAQAEKAIEALYGMASTGRSAILMRQFVRLAEVYGPQIMEERLKDAEPATRYRALGELIDLLKTAYRAEEDRAPKRKAGPRKVMVRDWPPEGAKS